MPDKFEIASYLRETGLLLSAKGENQFKARAYLRGAKAIEASQADIGKLVREHTLTSIPGIGESLAKTIEEIYQSGESKYLHRLKDEVPEGTVELSRIPGLTLDKIRKLTEALGIRTISELEQACTEEKVRLVPGFAARSERALLGKIQRMKTRASAILLVDALETAEEIISYMRSSVRGLEIEVTGDVRRWYEAVEKIQFVAKPRVVSSALEAFKKFPLVTEVIESSDDFAAVRLFNELRVELFIAENFTLKLLETTGPAHFLHLQKLAKRKGLTLNSDVFKAKTRQIEVVSETDVYKKLGLSFVPPELREDNGEVQLARKDDFSDLIHYDDIQGMTHCHSTYSDGRHSIEQMARAAERMGMKYMTITDHSPTAHYAGGLTVDRLKEQWEEIERVQEKVKIKLLRGTECDILADGELDYPDEILEQFDVIIASIHSRYKQDESKMMKRLLNGLRNPHFKIWGHPLGRLVLRRDPIPCDVEKILEAIQDSPVAIEINGDPYRLDLEPKWSKLASDLGFNFVISTDAHATSDLQNLPFGIHQARRAGIRRSQVLNAQSFSKFRNTVKPN
ncbi:MAG TPA: DNA polymerase/3'-5' exonuclease PolX [Candidatus Melainabacteria bacterium]|nr:DNA polymerase/3'-5' exonuclease PolX [Candidatus Melainabacteria bacterium]HIN64454.1 DNA polymerase/3'-5' exonuclease PolX [Candidatus Obscuribacterales bacterium]